MTAGHSLYSSGSARDEYRRRTCTGFSANRPSAPRCAPGGEQRQRPGQELRSASTTMPAGGPAGPPQRLPGVGIAADRPRQQAAGAGLGRRDRAAGTPRPDAGSRPARKRGVSSRCSGTSVTTRPSRPPAAAASTPAPRPRHRPRYVLEQHPHRIGAHSRARATRGDLGCRHHGHPHLPGLRIQVPGTVRAPRWSYAVRQLRHPLAVPRSGPGQPQRQHEIPRRRTATARRCRACRSPR